MSIEGSDESRHFLVNPLRRRKFFFSASRTAVGDPTHDHLAVAPASHVVGEVGDLAVEALDEVRRAQAVVEPAGGRRAWCSVRVSGNLRAEDAAAPG